MNKNTRGAALVSLLLPTLSACKTIENYKDKLIGIKSDEAKEKAYVGDFNGDGIDDLMVHHTAGDYNGLWQIRISNPYDPQLPATETHTWLAKDAGFGIEGQDAEKVFIGDFNGDHHDDVMIYGLATATWRLRVTDPENWTKASTTPYAWADGFGGPGIEGFVADFTADGRDDAIIYYKEVSPNEMGLWNLRVTQETGDPVAKNVENSDSDETLPWTKGFGGKGIDAFVADFTGDGKADVMIHYRVDPIDPVTGKGNTDFGKWLLRVTQEGPLFPHAKATLAMNEDNCFDINECYGDKANPPWASGFGGKEEVGYVGDFNGDKQADVMIHYPNKGLWELRVTKTCTPVKDCYPEAKDYESGVGDETYPWSTNLGDGTTGKEQAFVGYFDDPYLIGSEKNENRRADVMIYHQTGLHAGEWEAQLTAPRDDPVTKGPISTGTRHWSSGFGKGNEGIVASPLGIYWSTTKSLDPKVCTKIQTEGTSNPPAYLCSDQDYGTSWRAADDTSQPWCTPMTGEHAHPSWNNKKLCVKRGSTIRFHWFDNAPDQNEMWIADHCLTVAPPYDPGRTTSSALCISRPSNVMNGYDNWIQEIEADFISSGYKDNGDYFDGFVKDRRGEPWTEGIGNALLYTGWYYIVRKLRGEWDEKTLQEFHYTVAQCEIDLTDQGLPTYYYIRHPKDPRETAYDDYVAMATTSHIIDSNATLAIKLDDKLGDIWSPGLWAGGHLSLAANREISFLGKTAFNFNLGNRIPNLLTNPTPDPQNWYFGWMMNAVVNEDEDESIRIAAANFMDAFYQKNPHGMPDVLLEYWNHTPDHPIIRAWPRYKPYDGEACVWEHPNYAGAERCYTVGEARADYGELFDNAVSAVKVGKNVTLTLCDNADPIRNKGNCTTWTEAASDIGDFNDKASYLRVDRK